MMDNVEQHWKQLKLREDGNTYIVVYNTAQVVSIRRGNNSIIGKLHSNRKINKEILRNTMLKI